MGGGETSIDWLEKSFPILKNNPPLLLFTEDIEIWNPIDYEVSISEILNHEVYEISNKFRLVPFAKTGGGDLYVFQYDLQKDQDIPISLLPHDDDQLHVLARNLQDFIFRQLLEAVADIYDDLLFYDEDEYTIKRNLYNQLRTHRPYLDENQIKILEEIYKRDITIYHYKLANGKVEEAEGLLTFEEVEKIIKNEIDFEFLNAKIDYTN